MVAVAELTVAAGPASLVALAASRDARHGGGTRRVPGSLDSRVAERAAVAALHVLLRRRRGVTARDQGDQALPQAGLRQRGDEVLLVRERRAHEDGSRG